MASPKDQVLAATYVSCKQGKGTHHLCLMLVERYRRRSRGERRIRLEASWTDLNKAHMMSAAAGGCALHDPQAQQLKQRSGCSADIARALNHCCWSSCLQLDELLLHVLSAAAQCQNAGCTRGMSPSQMSVALVPANDLGSGGA